MTAIKTALATLFCSRCYCRYLIAATLASLAVDASSQADPWWAAVEAADARIAAFEQAVESGDSATIKTAALELQSDPIAVKRFNQNSTDAFRAVHNETTDAIKARTRELMREEMARKIGVDPEQITTFEATNPPKPGDPIKVGQDWDITVRVDGVDQKYQVAGQYVNDAYYEAVHGQKPPSDAAAAALADRQHIEVTSYQHVEAYGGSQTEGGKIISDPKGSPTLRDPEQLGHTIDYKSVKPGQDAKALENAGRWVEAQGFRMEQARQAAKQFDRQVAVRVAAMGGEVPDHLRRAMNVLRSIGDGKLTPAQGTRLLKDIGETIDSVAAKSAGLIESAQTLRPGGLGRADDVFVQNAYNRLRAKGIDPGELKPLDPNLDLSDLDSGSRQAVRSWGSTALKTLEAAGWAFDLYELSSAAYEYVSLALKVLDPNTPEDEAQAMFEKMAQAGLQISALGGMAAMFEAFPPAAMVFGVYKITELGLTHTETGQWISAQTLGLIDPEFLDDQYEAAARADCDLREFLGIENICAGLDNSKRELLLTYLRGINEGKLVLKAPFTAKDLGDMVLAGVDVSEMLLRVDEQERLMAANERYNAFLGQFGTVSAQCGDIDLTRAATRSYFEDTRSMANELNSTESLNVRADPLLGGIPDTCDELPRLAGLVQQFASRMMRAADGARQARDGSYAVLSACKAEASIYTAFTLFDKGSALTVEAASEYVDLAGVRERFELFSARLPEARARLDEISESLNEIDRRVLTLRNRQEVLHSQLSDIRSLEASCTTTIAQLEQDAAKLRPILGDQLAAHQAELRLLSARAAAKDKDYSAEITAEIEPVLQRASDAESTIGWYKTKLTSCEASELPVAELVAATSAARALPDVPTWRADLESRATECEQKLSAGDELVEAGSDDPDGRGDYEGYDADPGNVDPERLGAVRTDFDSGSGPAGLLERASSEGGADGLPFDPAYTFDSIEEERRERERAREARRVATARNNARRGRNDLADEFSDPQSAIDRLPDEPRTDNRERRHEEANEPLAGAENGENSSELSDEAPPPTALLPPDDDSQESPNESTETVTDSQDPTEQE
ncbi:MAG: hypothetical protein AAF662_14000, partial [Pseudomonadota bacterium]